MTEENKRILVISYTFPPFDGIGGRRWAKFAKYLHRFGYDVSVIAASKGSTGSAWTSDIEEYADTIDYVPSGYPELFQREVRSFYEKVLYRFLRVWLSIKIKGNMYDHSSFWWQRIEHRVHEQIERGVSVIIASGGPFTFLSGVVSLKKKYPNLKVFVDFRDPWTSNRTAFGYDKLSPSRRSFEVEREQQVVSRADGVLTVAEPMTTYFESLVRKPASTRFLTLPNGFDPEDYNRVAPHPRSDGLLKFVFTGTFYGKAERLIQPFIDALRTLEREHNDTYRDLRMEFIGTMSSQAKDALSSASCVEVFAPKERKQVYEHLEGAAYGLLFLTDDLNYSFSTKFCEYLAFDLPMLVFSKQGFTGSYLETNDIGIFGGEGCDEMVQAILHAVAHHAELSSKVMAFNKEPFSIPYLAKELEQFVLSN